MLCVMEVALVPKKPVLHILSHVLGLRKNKVQFSCRKPAARPSPGKADGDLSGLLS